MKQRSGMPYDVVAFSTDENAILWTLEEDGAFHRLMRHAWVNGSIPDDMPALAHICKCSVEKMEQLWVVLQKSWPLNKKTGRRTNPKQEQERKYVKAIAKKNSDNANKRWESRNATALQPHSSRNAPLPSPPHPNPTIKKGKKETFPPDDRRGPFVEFFFKEHESVRGVKPDVPASGWKSLKEFLERTKNNEQFCLDALMKAVARFMRDTTDFVRRQEPMGYFCTHSNGYMVASSSGSGSHGKPTEAEIQAAADRLKANREQRPRA